ncbi:MAG: putative lipopolysaccharide heptosyltransferase [Pseudomonadota bacterium]
MSPKILLINLRHIGDSLLITPLIANIKNSFPNAILDVLVNFECKSLFENNTNINKILAYNRAEYKKLGGIKRLIAELKFTLGVKNYDIVIATTEGERSAFLSFLSGAKTRVGIRPPKGIFAKFIKPYTHEYTHKELLRHTVERNLDALRAINVQIVSKKVELFFSKDDENHINNLLPFDDFVHIHAVSRWAFKNLPPQTVASVIDGLNLKVVLSGTEEDKAFNEEIIALCKTNKPLNLAGKLSLTQMAALSKNAKLFFGIDSAPMHIAASQGTPCVGVFGPSGVFNWGAWDNMIFECEYNSKNGVQHMGKNTMIQVNWDCAPCGQAGCDNSRISNCLLDIKEEDILNACLAKLTI